MPATNFMYTNADQFTTMKKSELLEFVERKKLHIIAICEMKPKVPRERTELDYVIPGYSLHPVNLDSNIVRRIIIYIHSSIDNCVIQINPDVKFSKVCLLEIRLCGGDNLLFGCFYRSPNTTSTSEKNKANLNNLLKYLSGKKHSHHCCVGDFNFRNINWFTWSTLHNEESKEPQFIETIRDCYLYQCLLKPTRSRSNNNPSLIDLVLTNEVMQASDIEYHAPLGKSDHCVINFKYHCYLDYSQRKERCVYHKTGFNSMRRQLVLSKWTEKFIIQNQSKSVDELWDSFKSEIHEIRNKFVPKQLRGIPSWKTKSSVSINQVLCDAIQNKSKLHRP